MAVTIDRSVTHLFGNGRGVKIIEHKFPPVTLAQGDKLRLTVEFEIDRDEQIISHLRREVHIVPITALDTEPTL